MNTLIVLIVLSVAGIGIALWLLKGDQEGEKDVLSEAINLTEDLDEPPEETPPDTSSQGSQETTRSSIFKKLMALKKKETAQETEQPADAPKKPKLKISLPKISLDRLTDKLPDSFKKYMFWKKDEEDTESAVMAEATALQRLKETLKQDTANAPSEEIPETGTASLRTAPADSPPQPQDTPETKEEKAPSGMEGGSSDQLKEWQEKYEKLDALFKEKSSELEKTKELLNNEINNRKEFNKVKDLMEKEIKDSKDKNRNIQAEGDNVKSEADNHKRRVTQLEEKIGRLEKELTEKEDKINDLVKRLQVFGSPPKTSTPPKQTETIKKELPEETSQGQPEVSPGGAQQPQDPKDEEPEIAEKAPEESSGDTASPDVSFEAEPPEPQDNDKEENPENQPKEENFLKLQPDVISQESPGSSGDGSVTSEIEKSIQAPEEPDIKMDPGQASKADDQKQTDKPAKSPDNENAIKIIDPDQKPPGPSNEEQKPKPNEQ